MIAEKEASVGVVVGVRHDEKPAAVLQVRSPHDSFPGACQVTAHGKLTEDELALPADAAFSTALSRKLREEIGVVATEMVEASGVAPEILNEVVNERGRRVRTVGIKLGVASDAFMKLLVPGKDVGGFRLCSEGASILPLEKSHKTAGVSGDETRMFPDEITAVNALLESYPK
jgi:hypothetical protein